MPSAPEFWVTLGAGGMRRSGCRERRERHLRDTGPVDRNVWVVDERAHHRLGARGFADHYVPHAGNRHDLTVLEPRGDLVLPRNRCDPVEGPVHEQYRDVADDWSVHLLWGVADVPDRAVVEVSRDLGQE